MNQLKQGANFASNNAAQFWTGNGIVSNSGGDGTATGIHAVGVLYNDLASVGQSGTRRAWLR